MAARHDSIGIKQVVRLEWYDYTLDLLQQGLPAKEIRAMLDDYLKDRLQTGMTLPSWIGYMRISQGGTYPKLIM